MGPAMMPQNKPNTDDLRIKEIKELVPPAHVFREYPVSSRAAQTTYSARQTIHRILHGADDRLLVIIGPCSIHDYDAAMEYARKLAREAGRHANDLVVLMRVYFEKPRTTVGWKGLINDPRMDNTFRINEGIRLARKILLEINELGLPCATEFLDTITPQYTADLIAWGAIGAHHRVAGAPRTGFRPVVSGRLQERNRWQHAHRGRRHPFGQFAASLPVGDQVRPHRHRVNDGQRGLPCHPARRQVSQLRRRQC
jgi:hypothetical protein